MSHHTTIRTRIADPDSAGEALRDIYPGATVETSGTGAIVANLYGTQQARGAVAVARRVGMYGEDVAIVRSPSGSLDLVVDVHTANSYRARTGRELSAAIVQRAAYHAIMSRARASGLETVADSTVNATVGG